MAWNEPGGNKNQDPWGNRGGNDGPPDLDEVFRKFQQKLGGIFGGNGGGSSRSSSGGGLGIGIIIAIIVAVWMARALATRRATCSEPSAGGGRARSAALTGSTSTCRSMRSSSGPETLDW